MIYDLTNSFDSLISFDSFLFIFIIRRIILASSSLLFSLIYLLLILLMSINIFSGSISCGLKMIYGTGVDSNTSPRQH